MTVERVLMWTCDKCGATVERGGYGLPDGWTYSAGEMLADGRSKPIHRCAECAKEEER